MVIALSDRLNLEKNSPSASFLNIFLFFIKVQKYFSKETQYLVIFFLFVLHLEKLKIFYK